MSLREYRRLWKELSARDDDSFADHFNELHEYEDIFWKVGTGATCQKCPDMISVEEDATCCIAEDCPDGYIDEYLKYAEFRPGSTGSMIRGSGEKMRPVTKKESRDAKRSGLM